MSPKRWCASRASCRTRETRATASMRASWRSLLRGDQLKPVYHGENGVGMLRELARSYLTTVKDVTRVMDRLKAVYRSRAIPCGGLTYTAHPASSAATRVKEISRSLSQSCDATGVTSEWPPVAS